MNPDAHDSNASTTRGRRVRTLGRMLAVASATLLAAGTAHAGTAELTHQTLLGMLAYFADPENVRGMFGAAAGAVISILVARPFASDGAEDSDDR